MARLYGGIFRQFSSKVNARAINVATEDNSSASYSNIKFTTLTSEEFMRQKPINEPVLQYKRGSVELEALQHALKQLSEQPVDVPLCIGEKRIFHGLEQKQLMPCDLSNHVARFTDAKPEDIREAIEVALDARKEWEAKPLRERAEILLRAADLCAGPYRMKLMAATMLGQGKNIMQAEIDAACEIIDFLRFNAYFALQRTSYQPISQGPFRNEMVYRGLDGFVAAIAPFNFTAIGGNLASAPALMGNVVLLKPSSTAVLSSHLVLEALMEAGLPPGVISFLPSKGSHFGEVICNNKHLAGINFTGSVPTYRCLLNSVAENQEKFLTFPKMVGECGGKNFHFVHPSADVRRVVACTIRAAFEYQGQKCSACSRLYVPSSLWPAICEQLTVEAGKIRVGDVRDPTVFMSAVIDAKAFGRIRQYIDYGRSEQGTQLVFGGGYDDSIGYFVQPTCFQVSDPASKLMVEEIFGPVLSVYVYDDNKAEEVLKSLKEATPYGLTGAVFSDDKEFLNTARWVLRDAVGNLYLNDKCTGAVVGQQPFGGARMSGTNDKAGGPDYCLRWCSPQTIKENLGDSLHEWRYPHMME